MREAFDTVVIGGGQAGLAMSYHLQQHGREHVVLERRRIAERWRTERWDSLHFQLPDEWLTLPGKPSTGSRPGAFPHYSEVIKFIEDYASEIAAPVRTGVEVTGLEADSASREYIVSTGERRIRARHVVIATGPFQRPLTPSFSKTLPRSIHQIDAAGYKNPESLPPGAVLVVGSGNTGCQIVDELLQRGRKVFFAISHHSRVPRRYRGKDVIWWFEYLGRFDVNIDSFPGRKYPPTSIMTGIGGGYDLDPCRLAHRGARLLGRVLGAEGASMAVADDTGELLRRADKSFDDFIRAADALAELRPDLGIGSKEHTASPPPPEVAPTGSIDLAAEKIGTIIWANGYGYSYDWVRLPVLSDAEVPIQQRGVTGAHGVYFLGLHWMHTFRSAILPFVGRDAAYVAEHIARNGP